MTKQEIIEYNKMLSIYDYYGIPHGVFDGEIIPKVVEKDWSKAILLIAKGEKIPEDLEKRLLQYKKDLEGTCRRC